MFKARYFLVYDCRDYQSLYLGRFLYVAYNGEEPSCFHIRRLLDSDSVLQASCTWRVKEIDCSLCWIFVRSLSYVYSSDSSQVFV